VCLKIHRADACVGEELVAQFGEALARRVAGFTVASEVEKWRCRWLRVDFKQMLESTHWQRLGLSDRWTVIVTDSRNWSVLETLIVNCTAVGLLALGKNTISPRSAWCDGRNMPLWVNSLARSRPAKAIGTAAVMLAHCFSGSTDLAEVQSLSM